MCPDWAVEKGGSMSLSINYVCDKCNRKLIIGHRYGSFPWPENLSNGWECNPITGEILCPGCTGDKNEELHD